MFLLKQKQGFRSVYEQIDIRQSVCERVSSMSSLLSKQLTILLLIERLSKLISGFAELIATWSLCESHPPLKLKIQRTCMMGKLLRTKHGSRLLSLISAILLTETLCNSSWRYRDQNAADFFIIISNMNDRRRFVIINKLLIFLSGCLMRVHSFQARCRALR